MTYERWGEGAFTSDELNKLKGLHRCDWFLWRGQLMEVVTIKPSLCKERFAEYDETRIKFKI